jgi:hypothetical protein
MMPLAEVTFEDLLARFDWRAMRGCPGRYLLAGGPTASPPGDLFGDLVFREGRSVRAPDRVLVAAVRGGGIISYAKDNGTFIHTLGDSAGFARKLAVLELADPGPMTQAARAAVSGDSGMFSRLDDAREDRNRLCQRLALQRSFPGTRHPGGRG